MRVYFATTRSDIDEMRRRRPWETDEQVLGRLVATRLEKATRVLMSLTPETTEEEAALEKAMEIKRFNAHLLTPPFQINEMGQKEYCLSF